MLDAAQLGAQLRAAGLTSRALDAWATTRLAALPGWLADRPARATTPAGALLELLVAGAEVPRALVRGPIDALIAHGLVAQAGDHLRAELAILPHRAGFLVCDRLDAPVSRERVSWPDDSSDHLARAIPPGRRPRWLDLACGSAFAPLARPQLADALAAADLNPRAVRCAQLGARLSGVALTCAVADIAEPQLAADLVTCNAPIPDAAPVSPELWRRAEPGFFDRLWPALAAAVRPGGLIVVHAALAPLRAGLADAAGERAIVRYTPDHLPGFAVAWWRPDGPARLVEAARVLTADRPHLDPEDRDAALC